MQALIRLLRQWLSLDESDRPTYLIQYNAEHLDPARHSNKCLVRLAFLVHFDEALSIVTLAEASIRSHACTWSLPVEQLWAACEAVGNLKRSGGILKLTPKEDKLTDSEEILKNRINRPAKSQARKNHRNNRSKKK